MAKTPHSYLLSLSANSLELRKPRPQLHEIATHAHSLVPFAKMDKRTQRNCQDYRQMTELLTRLRSYILLIHQRAENRKWRESLLDMTGNSPRCWQRLLTVLWERVDFIWLKWEWHEKQSKLTDNWWGVLGSFEGV